ncbi:MAG: hypothetical protein ACFWTZ_01175 [Burkholderia sp.]|jgi:hypothetical protein
MAALPNTPSTGLQWFSEGMRSLRVPGTIAFSGVVIFYLLMSGLLAGLPLVGLLLASLWMPFGSVMTGFAARDVLAGGRPAWGVLGQAWAQKRLRLRLLGLGVVSAAGMQIVLIVFSLLSKDQLSKWVVTEQGVDAASIAGNIPYFGIAVSSLLYVPLLMATVFAPLLLADAGQTLGKSLFYSFFGVVKNFMPSVTAGLCVSLSALVCGTLTTALFALSPFLASFVAALLTALLSMISQAMVWAMYRGIFGEKRLFGTIG